MGAFFLLIVPISLLYYFIGKDAWPIIKSISLIIGLSIIVVPIYILGGLARSGTPVPIGSFIYNTTKEIKSGVSELFKKKNKN
jgi:4-amino-4-deoxy-L-arabinose transferase-like glycosyltransferase